MAARQVRTAPEIASDTVLDEAKAIIYGDREQIYGEPGKNLTNIAAIWAVILGIQVTADQVALCMIGVKLARLVNQPTHRDSQVDIGGYAGLLERVQSLGT